MNLVFTVPGPGLSQTFFPFCLKYDLFRKTILTILHMLNVDHAFCERLYLCDFNRESMQSREVVQTCNRTSLSNRAAYGVRDFRNPVKIQGRTQKHHVPAPPKCQGSLVYKIIELCYLNSGMGSINIPTEDLSRH